MWKLLTVVFIVGGMWIYLLYSANKFDDDEYHKLVVTTMLSVLGQFRPRA